MLYLVCLANVCAEPRRLSAAKNTQLLTAVGSSAMLGADAASGTQGYSSPTLTSSLTISASGSR